MCSNMLLVSFGGAGCGYTYSEWLSSYWSDGIPASPPGSLCSASDETPVPTVDTSHTVAKALSATVAHVHVFVGSPDTTSSVNTDEPLPPTISLLDLRVFKKGA